MSRKRFTAEQIIHKLRQAEVELANGQRTAQVCKTLGIFYQTYYRWRREYGGLRPDQAKRPKRRRTVGQETRLETVRLLSVNVSQLRPTQPKSVTTNSLFLLG